MKSVINTKTRGAKHKEKKLDRKVLRRFELSSGVVNCFLFKRMEKKVFFLLMVVLAFQVVNFDNVK